MLVSHLIGDVSSKRLIEMVTYSNLNSTEIQAMIDVLLNKQGDNSQWKKVQCMAIQQEAGSDIIMEKEIH